MTGFLSAFGKAASFTARGAAVTFGSTVFSCAAACTIEKGANRMIYKYYPHKFANVEAASGITQEELDFVHFMYGGRIEAAAEVEEKQSTTKKMPEESEILYRYDSFEDSSAVNATEYEEELQETAVTIHMTETKKSKEEEKSAVDKFWTEGEEAANKALSLIPIMLPRQEILACSMTA